MYCLKPITRESVHGKFAGKGVSLSGSVATDLRGIAKEGSVCDILV